MLLWLLLLLLLLRAFVVYIRTHIIFVVVVHIIFVVVVFVVDPSVCVDAALLVYRTYLLWLLLLFLWLFLSINTSMEIDRSIN